MIVNCTTLVVLWLLLYATSEDIIKDQNKDKKKTFFHCIMLQCPDFSHQAAN